MTMGEAAGWIAAALSALASVLAWGARLLWGREFAAAKDETIRAKEAQLATKDETIKAKEAQIEALTQRLKEEKDLNPMKIREYFVSVKGQLEEYNNVLKGQLTTAEEKLGSLKDEIETERSRAAGRQEQVAKLEGERKKLLQLTVGLQKQVQELQTKQSDSANVLFNYDSLLTPLRTSISGDYLKSLTEVQTTKGVFDWSRPSISPFLTSDLKSQAAQPKVPEPGKKPPTPKPAAPAAPDLSKPPTTAEDPTTTDSVESEPEL
jgi:small-conductance mechanosensitive channel